VVLFNRFDTSDEGGGDRTHAGRQHTEPAFGRLYRMTDSIAFVSHDVACLVFVYVQSMCAESARRREECLQDSSSRNASFFFIYVPVFFYIFMS
jgi:hypothetical protein